MTNDIEETSVDGREQFDAAMFGKDMDAFDDFLDDIAPTPASPEIRIIVDHAMDILGDDSFCSDDSDDELSRERRNLERPQHTGALEQMMFKSAAPKLIVKFGDSAVAEDSRGSPRKSIARLFPSKGADSLSKSERGRKRDDLSKSEHGTNRKRDEVSRGSSGKSLDRLFPSEGTDSLSKGERGRKRDDLSKSEHGTNRKRDGLSRSSCRKRNDFAITSEHTSQRRSSHEENPLSRQRKLLSPMPPTSRRDSAEGSPADSSSLRDLSLSPAPPTSRRRSTSTATRRRLDESSQTTEHCKPRLRRDALYSRNVSKNDLDRSRRSRSSIDLEEVVASTRRQGSDRPRSVDAQTRRLRSTSREATESGVGVRRRKRSIVPLTEGAIPMQRYRSHASSAGMVRKGSSNNLKTVSEHSRSMRRSTSTVDACSTRKPTTDFDHLLFKTKRESVDARSMRKSTKDIDQLLFKTKRDSKTKTLSKMGNATWDFTAARD